MARDVVFKMFDSGDGPAPTCEEDRAILDLIEEGDFGGRIALLYTRRPSPWRSFCREGSRVRLLTGWDGIELLGMGAAITHQVWDEGREREMYYLCSFRVRKEGLWSIRFMPGAYARLIEACGRDGLFLTSILAENRPARRLLEKRRPSLPTYRLLGGFTTVAIRGGVRRLLPAALDWRWARREDALSVATLLRQQGARTPRFPMVTEGDLLAGEEFPPLTSFIVLETPGGAIRACGALWDQREWKQYVVMGYRGPLLWLRPLSRLLFPALGYPALPPVGDTLAFPTAAFLATDSEEPDLLRALLMALSHAAEKFPFFLAGSADEGPGAAVLRGFRGVRYRSLLYRVDPAGCDAEAGVGPCPHVELARL